MATMIHDRWMRVASGVVLGAAVSCTVTTEDNEDNCGNRDGNAFCAEKYADGSRPFCGFGIAGCGIEQLDGCMLARPAEDACYSPCGGGNALPDDPECEGVAEGSSSSVTVTATDATSEPTGGPTTAGSMSASGTETESSSGTTDGGCTLSLECLDPASPICVDEACVPCSSDDECLEKNPSAPACGDDGRCVVCTPSNASACVDTTPVCNAVNECEGCEFHEQCPDSACRIATGGCFDVAEVYDVGSGQTYASIAAAVADLGDGGEVVLRIHDGASYDGAVAIAGAGTAYAFLADDDAMVPQWVNNDGASPTLLVEGGAEVYVQSLRFTANTDADFPGITADGATLYLDRAQVVGNTGGGILLTGGAAGHLRNCFVGGNVNDVAALEVMEGAAADILYTTVVAADQLGDGAALRCSEPGIVTVRNSLLAMLGAAAEVQCGTATLTSSATESGIGGTTDLGNVTGAWFVSLSNDFSLNNPPGDVLTAAQWQAGDPQVDIDGDARPNVDGAPDVAGGDLP